jgi:hypothetical protein
MTEPCTVKLGNASGLFDGIARLNHHIGHLPMWNDDMRLDRLVRKPTQEFHQTARSASKRRNRMQVQD